MSSPEQTLKSFVTRLASSQNAGEQDLLAPSSSLLPCHFSSSASESACCVLPSLSFHSERKPTVLSPHESSIETAAARRLATPIELGKRSVAVAPSTVLRNIALSFGTMIDSRLKASTAALLKRSVKAEASGKEKDAKKQLKVLQSLVSSTSQSPILLTAASTNFRAFQTGRVVTPPDEKKRVAVLPLVFHAKISVSILGVRKVNVCLKAPGTATGSFTSPTNRLDSAHVVLDTHALLDCMRRRCRELVRKAIAIAYCRASRSVGDDSAAAFIAVSAPNGEGERNEMRVLPPPARGWCASLGLSKKQTKQKSPAVKANTR